MHSITAQSDVDNESPVPDEPQGPDSDELDPPKAIPHDLRMLVAVLVVGVSVDLALRRPMTSVAVVIVFFAVSGALFVSGRLVTRHSRILAALSPMFAVWAMFRVSPWLVPLDLLVAAGLLVIAVTTSSRRPLWSLTPRDLVSQPSAIGVDAALAARYVRSSSLEYVTRSGSEQVRSVGLGVAIAVPIVVILGLLLASGDALTGAVLGSAGLPTAFGHLVLVVLGAALAVVLIFLATQDDAPAPPAIRRLLGPTEAIIVLAAITALFAGFAALQVAGALGAADDLLNDPVATANWAREGFFQLLWAAGITLSVLIAVSGFVKVPETEATRRRLNVLSTTTALLTVVVVATSMRRIVAYSDTFGLTMLRLYAGLFAAWIAIVFVLYVARVWHEAVARWFAVAASVAALGILFGLNVANPEALVVRYDVTTVERFDIDYLMGHLSDDAIPELVESVNRLPEAEANALSARLCDLALVDSPTGLSWNSAKAKAQAALQGLCSPSLR